MRASADLIDRMINAISDSTMPPEDAESLDDDTRQRFVAALKEVLRQAALDGNPPRSGVARLNRGEGTISAKPGSIRSAGETDDPFVAVLAIR